MRYDVYAALSVCGRWVALIFDANTKDRSIESARILAHQNQVVFFLSFNDLLKWLKGAHRAYFSDVYNINGVDTIDIEKITVHQIDSSVFIDQASENLD